MSKGNRRADGALRPSRLRARALKSGVAFLDPDAVEHFWSYTFKWTRIWNSYRLRSQLGLDRGELGVLLERVAGQHKWGKCRDTSGVVRAIGLPANHRDRAAMSRDDHRETMLAWIVAEHYVLADAEFASAVNDFSGLRVA